MKSPTREVSWKELRDQSALEEVRGRVKPKTDNQGAYLEALAQATLTICVGPAGTGKTYLACAYGAQLLREGKVKKVVLCRPTVECAGRTGKGLGFLPGDMDEKLAPHMAALVDAFGELGLDVKELARKGQLEMRPLELMRGATLRHSFVILDEAQNCSFSQLYMLLTRLGEGTRMVVCGDDSAAQNDLGDGPAPLVDVVRRFRAGLHPDARIVRLTRDDIVRHPLVRWVDERLGTPAREEWFGGDCPACGSTFWYEDSGEDADLVECFRCSSLLSLFDENGDQSEKVSDIKGVKGKKTLEKRPDGH